MIRATKPIRDKVDDHDRSLIRAAGYDPNELADWVKVMRWEPGVRVVSGFTLIEAQYVTEVTGKAFQTLAELHDAFIQYDAPELVALTGYAQSCWDDPV